MKTFLILTEDKNREGIKEILASRLEGFTLYYGKGFWVSPGPGKQVYDENNLTILVLTSDKEVVKDIARDIKEVNNQESVLVVEWDTESEFV